jgi:hypothetical protein
MKTTIQQAQSHNHVFIDVGFLETQAANHVLFKHYSCHSVTSHNVKCPKPISNKHATCDLYDENKEVLSGQISQPH